MSWGRTTRCIDSSIQLLNGGTCHGLFFSLDCLTYNLAKMNLQVLVADRSEWYQDRVLHGNWSSCKPGRIGIGGAAGVSG
jgi:hypothetical protein